MEGQARELGDEPAVVAVDRQPRQPVPLAEDEPVGVLPRSAQAEDVAPEADRRLELAPARMPESSGPASQR